MKVTVIPIVISALGIIPEDLEIRGQEETIQTTALLRSARILRRVVDVVCVYIHYTNVQLTPLEF